MKNIVLTGFMASGKTTIGKMLAKKLDIDFIDTDCEIVKYAGKEIPAIFEQSGEVFFRDIESTVISKISETVTSSVISTGGGAVLREKNIQKLRNNGIVFNLSADLNTIFLRLGGGNGRPLANGKSREEIEQIFEIRKPFYANCDYVIDTKRKTVKQVCNEIIEIMKDYGYGEN